MGTRTNPVHTEERDGSHAGSDRQWRVDYAGAIARLPEHVGDRGHARRRLLSSTNGG